MNKTIMTNDEWAVGFMEQLDSMLNGIESMNEKSKASFGNERFLTDKEVSAWLKVSRRTLQDYRNKRDGVLLTSWVVRFSTRNLTSKSW